MPSTCPPGLAKLDAPTAKFYAAALRRLNESGIPFLLGGAYALQRYTGIERHTKDLDVFVRPEDSERVLRLFAEAGYRTEMTFSHWLGKVYHGDAFIDVIFCSGNGVARVDDAWFEYATPDELLGVPVRLCPPEEMIWSKSYVIERERYDGADIAHLIRACGKALDWSRLLGRFGPHWRVFFTYLVLFGFIYPAERDLVPRWLMEELIGRLRAELDAAPSPEHLCQGTLLSREQFLPDIGTWGYQDARLVEGTMSPGQVEAWTEAIGEGAPKPACSPGAVTPREGPAEDPATPSSPGSATSSSRIPA